MGKKLSKLEQCLIDAGMLNIALHIPGIQVDLKYSYVDNFLGEAVYPAGIPCYVLPETADKLKQAQELLKAENKNYSLIIYDGARPHSAQVRMYEIVCSRGQSQYIANPARGSMHNFGAAVDLSIFDLKNGKELDMGTEFDDFSSLSQPRYQARFLQEGKLSSAHIDNRKLLRSIMRKAGFKMIQTEWWHFEALDRTITRKKYKMIK